MSKHLVFTHSATEAEVLHSSLVLLGRVLYRGAWLGRSGCSTNCVDTETETRGIAKKWR